MQTHGLVGFLSLVLAAGAAAVVAATAAPAHDTAARTRGLLSQAEHDANRYADAYGRVAALADGGHLPSAQLALVMHDQGRALFGSEWSASPDQRRRWNTLVINAARQRLELPDNDSGD
jgi:hypothetical protein